MKDVAQCLTWGLQEMLVTFIETETTEGGEADWVCVCEFISVHVKFKINELFEEVDRT